MKRRKEDLTCKALEAQRMQMLAEYEQADAALKESE